MQILFFFNFTYQAFIYWLYVTAQLKRFSTIVSSHSLVSVSITVHMA